MVKVVSYYDLSVLSMSVMGFQNGWGELYPVLFCIFGILFNFAKPLNPATGRPCVPALVDYAALSNNRCISDQLGRQRIHVHGNR